MKLQNKLIKAMKCCQTPQNDDYRWMNGTCMNSLPHNFMVTEGWLMAEYGQRMDHL